MDEDISSLSAIFLNNEYYEFLKEGQMLVDGVPTLKPKYIISFKAKAWLDLTERKENGEVVDSKNIRKHKNDVFRMAMFLTEESRIVLPKEIKKDMERFIEGMRREKLDIKGLGIVGKGQEEIIKFLEAYYI